MLHYLHPSRTVTPSPRARRIIWNARKRTPRATVACNGSRSIHSGTMNHTDMQWLYLSFSLASLFGCTWHLIACTINNDLPGVCNERPGGSDRKGLALFTVIPTTIRHSSLFCCIAVLANLVWRQREHAVRRPERHFGGCLTGIRYMQRVGGGTTGEHYLSKQFNGIVTAINQ